MTRNRNELNTTSPLTAHEVCLVLMDVALGKRIMMRSSIQSWNEIYHGLMPVEIDCWQLTLFNDCDTLDYCEYCSSPDGRVGSFEIWQRYAADSVELLSGWLTWRWGMCGIGGKAVLPTLWSGDTGSLSIR